MTNNQNTPDIENEEQTKTESRRKFLKKAGAFALYTPPAIALLMQPSQASVMKSPGGHHSNHNRQKENNKHEKHNKKNNH